MAKLGKMPQKEIIDGFKGLIDFYYWKGIPVARRWPRYFPRTPSPAEATIQTAFAYINRLWSALPLIVNVQLTLFAARSTLTGKDFLVRGYIKGLYHLMPPEYYATEATQLALLAQLDVALSTRALEAGGNLAAILAQLDVALSTRALEAGGNLADIHARLDAIQISPIAADHAGRQGALASGVGVTAVASISAIGNLLSVDFSTDYNLSELQIVIDGHTWIVPSIDGSTWHYLSPLRLNALAGSTACFQEGLYDHPNTDYSLFLKNPIPFFSSFSVNVRQQSGVNKNIFCHVYWNYRT